MASKTKEKVNFGLKPIIVIGAGHAGMQFVSHLVDKEPGVRIILIDGHEEWPYYKPALSKEFLANRHFQIQDIRAPAWFQRHGVMFLRGVRLRSIDTKFQVAYLDNGKHVLYSRLILATGLQRRVPDIPGLDLKGVTQLQTRADAEAFRRWVNPLVYPVILGGGLKGVEAATALSRLSRKVTIIESGPCLLGGRVSPLVSELCRERLERSGCRIYLNTTITQVVGDAHIRAVELDNGERLRAEALIVATGAELDTRIAEEAGIACDDGILVDGAMRTSAPKVYAIGDCARYNSARYGRSIRLESIQNANDTAVCAVAAVRGETANYNATSWFWSEVGGFRLQICGLRDNAKRFQIVGDRERCRFSAFHFAGDELVAVESVNDERMHFLARCFFDLGRLPSEDDVVMGRAHLQARYNAWREEARAKA